VRIKYVQAFPHVLLWTLPEDDAQAQLCIRVPWLLYELGLKSWAELILQP